MNRVLVLGNSPQINDIDFSRLDPSVTTLGVNRIWLKHIPDYLFFNDIHIFTELTRSKHLDDVIRDSTTFCSDWINGNRKHDLPEWIQIHNRSNKKIFPDSVTTGIRLYSQHYDQSPNTTYYVAGVSLKWDDVASHFWKALDHPSFNTYGKSWYAPRFDKIFLNFKMLRHAGFKIVSVTPNSQLNKLFRYENIENLFSS